MISVKSLQMFVVMFFLCYRSESGRISSPIQVVSQQEIFATNTGFRQQTGGISESQSILSHLTTPRREQKQPQNDDWWQVEPSTDYYVSDQSDYVTVSDPEEVADSPPGEVSEPPPPHQEGVVKPEDAASPCTDGKPCRTMDESRNMRIEMTKQTILRSLGIEAPPNVTRRLPNDSPVVQAMLKKYNLDQANMTAQLEEDTYEPIKNEKVVSVAKRPPFPTGKLSVENWFYFEFTEEERADFDVRSADLWYYIRPSNLTSGRASIELDSYQREYDYDRQEYFFYPQMVKYRALDLSSHNSSGYWRKLSVTSLVSGWLKRPEKNLGIRLLSKGIPNLIATGSRPGEEGFEPFLDVELVTSKRRRKRQTIRYCSRSSKENRCCMYDMTIDFLDIGWDWIIFPTTYNAKHCSGHCSLAQMTTMRGTIQQRMPNQSRSCCVPKQYASLNMLYYDGSGNIIYSKVPDMEIRRCDCV